MNITLKNLTPEETKSLLPNNLIFLGYRGSIAHGLYVPNTSENSIDDKDIMGIFIGPKDYYLGIMPLKDTKEKFIKEWDSVCYELRKMIHLLIKGNPNVLSMLWLNENYIIYNTEYGRLLREHKRYFVSKKVYHSFVGYAHSQLHRMTHFKFEGYMGEKRKRLVEKYKFDCKNASHLIRLLKMGIEFLVEGTLYVERTTDSQQLLEIKRGEWKLEQVQAEADRLFKLCENAYVNCKLPNEPDVVNINRLVIDILEDYLK